MPYINWDKGKFYTINGCSLRHFYKKNFLMNIESSLGHFYKKNFLLSIAALWDNFIKRISLEL